MLTRTRRCFASRLAGARRWSGALGSGRVKRLHLLSSSFMGRQVISDLGAQSLREYKYVGADMSFTYKYALSPIADWTVQHLVPLWVAPNLLTLLALAFPVISLFLYAIYTPYLRGPEGKEEPPAWAHFFNAVALLLYQTLDNADGKQARRTKSSSALGMVFDHGCDAINAGVGAINLLVSLGIPLSDVRSTLAALGTPFVPFYFATLEEYYLGQLILPIINGPSEGVLLGVAISCISGVYRSQWWQQPVPFDWAPKGLRPIDILATLSVVGYVITIAGQMWAVLQRQRRNGDSIIRPLVDALPFAALALGTWTLLDYHDGVMLKEHPRVLLGTVGAIFVEMAVALMLAHVTHEVYEPHKRVFVYPFVLYVAMVRFGLFGDQGEKLAGLTLAAAAFVYTTVYLVVVVLEMSAILGLSCFRIKPQAEETENGGKMKTG